MDRIGNLREVAYPIHAFCLTTNSWCFRRELTIHSSDDKLLVLPEGIDNSFVWRQTSVLL
ncbi:MAG: hypothetical protein K2J78_01425 [Muribaculaceae bacterium]|nr:hypothetical protein [Muribaculaceae bacterium]